MPDPCPVFKFAKQEKRKTLKKTNTAAKIARSSLREVKLNIHSSILDKIIGIKTKISHQNRLITYELEIRKLETLL